MSRDITEVRVVWNFFDDIWPNQLDANAGGNWSKEGGQNGDVGGSVGPHRSSEADRYINQALDSVKETIQDATPGYEFVRQKPKGKPNGIWLDPQHSPDNTGSLEVVHPGRPCVRPAGQGLRIQGVDHLAMPELLPQLYFGIWSFVPVSPGDDYTNSQEGIADLDYPLELLTCSNAHPP